MTTIDGRPVRKLYIGRQGPAGPAGVGAPHTHNQSSPAATWTINHNLGRRPAGVAVYIGGALVDAAVSIVSVNTIEIAFSSARAGAAEVF